jgi:thioredoxin 1
VHIGACQNAANTNGTVKQNISVEEFDQKLAATPGVQLIDARTPEEYAGGHLKNAVNINYNSADLETQLAKLDKSKPVMVYCLSGGRSGKTATKMQEMGFKEVYNMDGGIMKWGSAGKPVEKGGCIQ